MTVFSLRSHRLQKRVMSPLRLRVLSTLETWSGCFRRRVPSPSDFTAHSLMKLWVALLSSRASVSVFLCHMYTEIGIVIESVFLLYMVATTAGAATVRARQSKNPRPYRGRRGKSRVLPQSYAPRGLGSVVRARVSGGRGERQGWLGWGVLG
jgi:hypothetical protein